MEESFQKSTLAKGCCFRLSAALTQCPKQLWDNLSKKVSIRCFTQKLPIRGKPDLVHSWELPVADIKIQYFNSIAFIQCCPSNFFSKNSCFKYASTSISSNSSAHVSAFLPSYTALVEIGEENRQHYIKGKWHWCILDYICCKAFGRVVLKLSESHYFSPQALLYSGPSFLHASAVKKLQCNYNQQLNEYICVPLLVHKYSDGPHMQVSVKLQLLRGQTRFMHHWCITHASINEVTSPRIKLYQNQFDLSTRTALAACVEYLHRPARITKNAFLCKMKKKKPLHILCNWCG